MPVVTEYPVGTFGFPGLCSGDAVASKKFYAAVLGWEPRDMEMGGGSFTMFEVEGTGVAGMYEMPADRKQAGVQPHWNSYISVADAEATANRAAQLGGKVLLGPFDAEGDVMANLEDPFGAKFSVWETRTQPPPARMFETGALCWATLYTPDTDRAGTFYSELFGWQPDPFVGGLKPYTRFLVPSQKRHVGGTLELTEDMGGMRPQWVPYFMVDDVDAAIKRVQSLNGQACGPWDIPNVGRIASLRDSEGAGFAVIAPANP